MKKLTGKFTFYDILSLFMILACLVAGLILMPHIPPQVPTHWNIEGNVDGMSPSHVVLFWMPLFFFGIYLIVSLLPLIDPKRNYDKFIKPYSIMKLVIISFLAIIHGIILCAAMGINVSIHIIVPCLVGFLFIFFGLISPKIKQNYFIGFRTPWAIENPVVWEKTQKNGRNVLYSLRNIDDRI